MRGGPSALLRAAARRLEESLLVRLVASFLALVLLVVALTSAVAYVRARATLRATMLERLRTMAFVKENQLDLWIADQRGDLELLASLPLLASDATRLASQPAGAAVDAGERMAQRLVSAERLALDMTEIFLLSAVGGRVLASTDTAQRGTYMVGEVFFNRGKLGTFIQNVYLSPATGRPTMTIATPVRNASGATVAVLAGHVNLDRIDELLGERTGLGATGEAYLVTPLHEFVSAGRFGRPEARRGVHSRGVDSVLAGRNGAGAYRDWRGVPVLGAYRWNGPRQLGLVVEIHEAEALAPAGGVAGAILMFGALASLAFTVGIWLLARRITRPVLAVADAATRVAGGDFAAVAPVVTRDEVGVLARTFNLMTVRLEELYNDLNRQVDATSRAYRALEESQHLLRAVVDNTANLIVVLDAEARFLLVNRRFQELFGVADVVAHGRAPAEVLPPGPAGVFADAARHVLAGRPVVERDAEFDEGGTRRAFHLVVFPLAEGSGPPFGVGIVGVDLSERTRAEEERRQLEAGVQQAQKLESLGLLAGGVAHDFNNILTAIVGGASMAMADLPPGSNARADLEQVIAAAERAAKLTRQMLAYAGRASLAIESFDLNAVIGEMAELIAVSVPKRVRLVQDLAADLPPIRGDRTQASQVVLNLVTNAAEAIGDRDGTVRVTTGRRAAADLAHHDWRLAPADAPAYVELVVADDGSGIAAGTIAQMFDPFFSTKGSGRGLGLAAVLGIVKQAGGSIAVKSAPGSGTVFRVVFPAAAGTVPVEPPARPSRPVPGGSGTVLLVDDEAVVRRATRRVLERAGYAVVEATHGGEAVDAVRRDPGGITAVVLDVTMPVMGGAEAYRRMRDLGLTAPVLVSSGYDGGDTAASFEGEGVDFLQKPYRPEQLLTRLRAMAARA